MQSNATITDSLLPIPGEPGTFENDRHSSLPIEVIEHESEFLAMRPVWDTLVEKSSGDIFQTFDWQSQWWKYYGAHPDRKLHILVVRHESGIVGICPFFVEVEQFLGISFKKRFRMMGSVVDGNGISPFLSGIGPSDYLDIIADPDYREDVALAFVGYLRDQKDNYDEVEMLNIPERSVFRKLLIQELRKQNIHHQLRQADICPRMVIPGETESFLRRLKPEVRRRINQVQRAAKEMYAVVPVQTAEELITALERLIALHQKRWNQIGYPGLFADGRFRRFQEHTLPLLFAQNRIWCKTVEMDGQCVAVRIGFRFNATIYDYLSGFDYDSPASKRRPGIALLYSMVEDGISSGIRSLDFLRGDEEYKFDFADTVEHNLHITIVGGRARSAVMVSLKRVVDIVRLFKNVVQKELMLIKIQYRVHGFTRFINRYVMFRTERLRNKLNKSSSSNQKA